MFNKYKVIKKGSNLTLQIRYGWLFPVWETVCIVRTQEENGKLIYGTLLSIAEKVIADRELNKENLGSGFNKDMSEEELREALKKARDKANTFPIMEKDNPFTDNTPLSEDNIDYLKENKRDKPALDLKSKFINVNGKILENKRPNTDYSDIDSPFVNNHILTNKEVKEIFNKETTKEDRQRIIDIINKNKDKLK